MDPQSVVGSGHTRQDRVLLDQGRSHRQPQAVLSPSGSCEQSDRVTEPTRVGEVDRADAADPLHRDLGGRCLHAECKAGQDGQLRARVKAVNVGAGIGLRISQVLRFPQDVVECCAGALNLSQDVVRGAVEDSDQRVNPVSCDPFAQGGQNGNATGHGCFHPQARPLRSRLTPEFGPVLGEEFLVGGHDRLSQA